MINNTQREHALKMGEILGGSIFICLFKRMRKDKQDAAIKKFLEKVKPLQDYMLKELLPFMNEKANEYDKQKEQYKRNKKKLEMEKAEKLKEKINKKYYKQKRKIDFDYYRKEGKSRNNKK